MTDRTSLSANAVREIERIVLEGTTEKIEVAGKEYVTRPVHDPRKDEPVPKHLGLTTLQSLADFTKDQAGTEAKWREGVSGLFLHVEGPSRVSLRSGIFGEFHQRAVMAVADPSVGAFAFGQWLVPEEFNIGLLSLVEPTDARKELLQLTGTIRDEAVQTIEDDGVTQRAAAAKGTHLKREVTAPVIVNLRPYRSFPEVEQVESSFLFRLRGGGDGRLPTCALFECDGGRWRLEAIARVKAWLAGELPGVAIYG